MANHITTQITVSAEQFETIKALYFNENEVLDFKKVIEHAHTQSGQKMDFKLKVWGCESAYDFCATETQNGVEIKFFTHWYHPLLVIEQIAKDNPTLSFDVKYASDDMGYDCGAYSAQDGEIINHTKAEPNQSQEAKNQWKDFAGALRYGKNYWQEIRSEYFS